jgi:hypothetical protein
MDPIQSNPIQSNPIRRTTYLLRDADVRGEGGEIGVGDEQEDAVVRRKMQLGGRHDRRRGIAAGDGGE